MKKIFFLSLALGLATQANAEEYKMTFETNAKPFVAPAITETCFYDRQTTQSFARKIKRGGTFYIAFEGQGQFNGRHLGSPHTYDDELSRNGYVYRIGEYQEEDTIFFFYEACRKPL